MVEKDKLISILICTILFVWIALPTGFNVSFGIAIKNTLFRFNVWFSIILCILLLLLSRNRSAIGRNYQWFGLFVFYCVINTFFHLFNQTIISASTGIDAILTLVLPFILVKSFSGLTELINRKRVIVFLKVMGLYLILQVFLTGFIATFRGWDSSVDLERTSTTLGESNCTAYFLTGIGVLLIVEYLNFRKKADLILLVFVSLAILRSQSRGAVGLLILIFAVNVLFGNSKGKLRLVLFGIIALFGIYFTNPDVLYNLYLRIFTGQSSGSDMARELYRSTALAEFGKRPVTGAGIGLLVYRLSRINRYITDIPNPHNQWASLLAETGIMGTAIFVFSQISLIKRSLFESKNVRVIAICFSLYLVFGFMFEAMFTAEIRASLCFWIYWILIEYYSAIDGEFNEGFNYRSMGNR